jgi:hypothetical protein
VRNSRWGILRPTHTHTTLAVVGVWWEVRVLFCTRGLVEGGGRIGHGRDMKDLILHIKQAVAQIPEQRLNLSRS